MLPPVAPHLKNAPSRLGPAPRCRAALFLAERRIRGSSALMRHIKCSADQLRLKGKPCIRTATYVALDPELAAGPP